MRFQYFLLSFLCCFAVALTLTAPAAAQSKQTASAIRSACPSDFRSLCAGVKTGGQEALACLQKNASRLSAACRAAVEAAAPPPAAPAQAEPAPKASPAPVPAPIATPAPAPVPTQAAPAPVPAPQAPAVSAPPPTPAPEKTVAPAKPAAPTTKQATPPAQPKAPAVKQAAPPAKPAEPLVVTPPAQPQPPTVAAPSQVPSQVERVVLVKQCGLEIQVHCREIPEGDGRVLACLMQNESKLRPRCRVALKAVSN